MGKTRAERREEIATAMMVGLCSPPHSFATWEDQAMEAVAMANALMDELDKHAEQDAVDIPPAPV